MASSRPDGVHPATASAATVDEILALYDRCGHQRYDEAVEQLEHAQQAAALAAGAGARDALVAAALLHDVGHLLAIDAGDVFGDADARHEDTGAAWLRPLLPVSVTAPIALHVRAKRYLWSVDPVYQQALSVGSMRSLGVQGGPLNHDECRAFEALPGHADAVTLRRWDDGAKVAGLSVPPLETYRELLDRLVSPAG